MCQPRAGQKPFEAWGCNCGCCGCGCGIFTGRFISAKEEQERLEKYRDRQKSEFFLMYLSLTRK
jgi:predicted nucleic acid-binding Zn ribbon protein